MIYYSIVLSIMTLTAISLERYFGIDKPLVHPNMTTYRLKYFLFFAWPTAFIGPVIFSRELIMDKTTYYCFFSPDEKDWPLSKIITSLIALPFLYIIAYS